MAYGPSRTDKEPVRIPCGRTYDHEEHPWYSDPSKVCPGVIAQPVRWPVEDADVDYRAGGVRWEQCSSTLAHGQHQTSVNGNVWCKGIKAHPDTMIGRQ